MHSPIDATRENLPCPICGYDLRGSVGGLCPECGNRFDPHELRVSSIPWVSLDGFWKPLTRTFLLVLFRPLKLWRYSVSPVDDRMARRFMAITYLPWIGLLVGLCWRIPNWDRIAAMTSPRRFSFSMGVYVPGTEWDLLLPLNLAKAPWCHLAGLALFLWLLPRAGVTPFALLREHGVVTLRAKRAASLTRYLAPGYYVLIASLALIWWSGFHPFELGFSHSNATWVNLTHALVGIIGILWSTLILYLCPLVFLRKAGGSLFTVLVGGVVLPLQWIASAFASCLVCIYLPGYLYFAWQVIQH